ncbi:MAG: CBS domain-containing protein [Pseudomonadota bacterium]
MVIRSIRQVVKDRSLNAVAPTATICEACAKLNDADVGALAVMDGDQLVGIVSERDVVRRAVGKGMQAEVTMVREIMTEAPATIDADASLADALQAMLAGRFRHMPVTSDGAVHSMLSIRDIPTEYRLMWERFTEYQDGDPELEAV